MNSRAGTIAHEMSHWILAGGTQNFAYSTANRRQLGRANSVKVLNNADNFEFYVENIR